MGSRHSAIKGISYMTGTYAMQQKLLLETLQEWGFTLNLYDKCVANKIIEGKQCTITWHVDELKLSHANKDIKEWKIY